MKAATLCISQWLRLRTPLSIGHLLRAPSAPESNRHYRISGFALRSLFEARIVSNIGIPEVEGSPAQQPGLDAQRQGGPSVSAPHRGHFSPVQSAEQRHMSVHWRSVVALPHQECCCDSSVMSISMTRKARQQVPYEDFESSPSGRSGKAPRVG